ncbi:hypothetical protein, partial [Xanthomonas euvesicatoria]|uniref:hypothetical protein n=1 Tax=Xanthomonas euvesicatoria TaxID=456327 RepID=UPI001C43DA32
NALKHHVVRKHGTGGLRGVFQGRLNNCWEYTFNAMQFKPLIYLDSAHPERVYCPLPSLLETRLLEGLFFDLYTKGEGFEIAYGQAVDELIGRILLDLKHLYEISKPIVARAKGGDIHGADWILQSELDCVFIECKAKRMSMAARVAERADDLRKELTYLAKAVVQNYRNIIRFVENQVSGRISCRNLYCVVVTLEDWILFSPITHAMIRKSVEEELSRYDIPSTLINQIPYQVMSTSTFQYCLAALKNSSISEVFTGIADSKYDGWSFDSYLKSEFPALETHSVGEFGAEFDVLFKDFIDSVKT